MKRTSLTLQTVLAVRAGRFVLAMLVFCCSPTFAHSGDRFSEYRLLPENGAVLAAPDLLSLARNFLISRNAERHLEKLMVLERGPDDEQFLILIETRGYRDDSVLGENFLLDVQKNGDTLQIQKAGAQSICARGASAGQATKELCP